MKAVNLFLARFQELAPADLAIKLAVIEVVKDVAGLELDQDKIKVEKSGVYLQVSSIIKNAIFLNREQIISEITRKLNKQIKKVV